MLNLRRSSLCKTLVNGWIPSCFDLSSDEEDPMRTQFRKYKITFTLLSASIFMLVTFTSGCGNEVAALHAPPRGNYSLNPPLSPPAPSDDPGIVPGILGVTGATGTSGPTGDPGSPGSSGETGASGVSGQSGSTGCTGGTGDADLPNPPVSLGPTCSDPSKTPICHLAPGMPAIRITLCMTSQAAQSHNSHGGDYPGVCLEE
jgi:hypothetical protein